jgi:hypothetical protein
MFASAEAAYLFAATEATAPPREKEVKSFEGPLTPSQRQSSPR